MGLRTKLIVAVVAVVALGFGVAGLLATRYVEAVLLAQVESRGRALLGAMAPPCAAAMANGEPEVVDDYLGQVSEPRRASTLRLRYVMLLDHRGRIFAHSDPTLFGDEPTEAFYREALGAERPLSRRLDAAAEGPTLEVTSPVVSGVRWGTLVAGFSLDPMMRTVALAQTRLVAATVGLAALTGIVLFWLLTRSVLGPIGRLMAATEAFGRGELSRRVKPTGRDAIARLGVTFDRMADELESHTVELEQKVELRTEQIAEKNRELTMLNKELRDKSEKLQKLAITDGLTGLFNHRHFQERLAFEVSRSERAVHGLSVVMIDVDHFKHYNDRNGHPAGDAVLSRIAAIFQESLRAIDVVARYGGEEFVAILLDTNARGAAVAAEKIRQAVVDEPFAHREAQPGGALTVSIGVASFPQHATDAAELVAEADRALYLAKTRGRNRVVVAARPSQRASILAELAEEGQWEGDELPRHSTRNVPGTFRRPPEEVVNASPKRKPAAGGPATRRGGSLPPEPPDASAQERTSAPEARSTSRRRDAEDGAKPAPRRLPTGDGSTTLVSGVDPTEGQNDA